MQKYRLHKEPVFPIFGYSAGSTQQFSGAGFIIRADPHATMPSAFTARPGAAGMILKTIGYFT